MANPIEPVTAQDGFAVTKSDTTVFTPSCALFVGGAGDVVVTTAKGNSLTFTGVTAGSILPITCTQVKAATTATNIVRLTY